MGITAAVMAVLMVVAAVLVNTPYVQNKLLRWATKALSEKLDTRISIDSVSVDIFGFDVSLYGVDIEDRQQRKMLQLQELSADIQFWPLLKKHIIVNSLEVSGLNALLLKPSAEEPGNWQFVIDAFKKDSTATDKKQKHHKLSADISHVKLHDVHVQYNTTALGFCQAVYDRGNRGSHALTLDSLNIKTDNGKPRKNVGKKHRGFFDTGHLNLTVNINIGIDSLGKDTLIAHINRCEAYDKVSGIDIRALTTAVHANPRQAQLTNFSLQQTGTIVRMAEARVQLPDKKAGRHLAFSTSTITGRTVLKDIARAFAPTLSRFTMPVNFQTRMDGNDNTLRFHDIRVHTDNNKLKVRGTGNITHLREKKRLSVIFRINSMNTDVGTAEKIINQFAVKKLMMGQLRRLGTIAYNGWFHVGWKTVDFHGRLQTGAGPMHFNFTIDGLSKYLTGDVRSTAFALGKVMNLPKIGDLACSAKFKIDISKQRTAQMRRQKGGKLPIGTVSADIDDCSYKKTHVRNMSVSITSDGAEATGDLVHKGKFIDLNCSFSFTDTDAMHKMKIMAPGIHLHKKTEAEKQQHEAEKAQKKAERAQKKAEKQAAREQKKAEREQKKAEKKAAREQKKAEKQTKATTISLRSPKPSYLCLTT